MEIELPISKSIANRWLVLQALHGDILMSVTEAMPDDVRLLHDALQVLQRRKAAEAVTIDVRNCGTAMRFLTAYCAQLRDCEVLLTGVERMWQRPIGQLVEALRSIGADIEYTANEGYPPLRIRGRMLPMDAVHIADPLSTQFVSALLLIGVPVATNIASPYIEMTRAVVRQYEEERQMSVEADWSAAAFWYEYVALHGGELLLRGLRAESIQGDKAVADLFERLGVATHYCSEGAVITRKEAYACPEKIVYDFAQTPDLYPATAICCEQMGVVLEASGIESLVLKESNRIEAVAQHQVRGDHRIAMALLAADLACDDKECISKSYPNFYEQLCACRRLSQDGE